MKWWAQTFYLLVGTVLALLCCADSGPNSPPVEQPSGPDTEPAWDPTGRLVAYVHAPNDSAEWALGPHQLRVFSLETGQSEFVTTGRSPDWSPSGDEIVYVYGQDIWVLTLESGMSRRLTDVGYCAFPKWSPLGDRILFRRWTQASLNSIWVCTPDGTGLRDLGIQCGSGADWGPGTHEIVFTSYEGSITPQVGIFDTLAQSVRELTSPPYYVRYPAASPTGGGVAFLQIQVSGEGPAGGIYIADVDQRGVHLLAHAGEHPAWNPDGNYVVCEAATDSAGDEGGPSLLVLDVRTGESTRLGSLASRRHLVHGRSEEASLK